MLRKRVSHTLFIVNTQDLTRSPPGKPKKRQDESCTEHKNKARNFMIHKILMGDVSRMDKSELTQ